MNLTGAIVEIAVGVGCATCYGIGNIVRKRHADLVSGLTCGLSAAGVLGGVRLVVLGARSALMPSDVDPVLREAGMSLNLALGGVALAWVALGAVATLLRAAWAVKMVADTRDDKQPSV